MPRQSAAVYRRRRLLVLGGLILTIAVLGVSGWLLVAQLTAPGPEPEKPGTSSQKPSNTPTEGSSQSPTPEGSSSSSPTPDTEETPGVVACEAKDIVVAAVTDADVYPAGVLPKLSISLTNNGQTDCTLDVGSSTQAFTVSSGTDVWWRSTDCQENPSSMIATLAAGATVTSKDPVTWDRTRSSVDSCAQSDRPRAPGGGASYHVSVEIGGFSSPVSKQFLLE